MTQHQNNIQAKPFFQSDRAILLLCMGIALVFWVLIKLSQNYRTTQEFALVYNKPAGKTFTNTPPEALIATLDGQGWDLLSNYFSAKDRKLSLNLSNASQQTYNSSQLVSKLSPKNKDIEISNINIDLLMINIEDELVKTVPVRLDQSLELSNQYQMKGAVVLTPDSVVIKGPTSVVDSISEWYTTNWSLKNVNANKEKNLDLVKPENELLSVTPTQVSASLTVEQLTEKSLFVPITIKNAPDSLKIFPENIKVSCIVGLGRYNDVQPKDFSLEVDLNGIALNAENNTLPILLSRQPDYVTGVKLNHQSVEFFFVQAEKVPETETEKQQ